jgi:hypothetical protein
MLFPSTQSFYTLSLLISTWGLVHAAPVPQKHPSAMLEARDINFDLSVIERRDIEPVQLERRAPPRSNVRGYGGCQFIHASDDLQGPPGTNRRGDAAVSYYN